VPPLTLENAGALVPGGVTQAAIDKENKLMQQAKPAQQPTTQKVRVLRSFYYQGKAVEKNETVTLPRIFAAEMKAANKVAFVADEAEKPAAAPTAAPAPASKDAPGDKKGERNAR